MELPTSANTTKKRLACCLRTQQRMMDWHNEVCATLSGAALAAWKLEWYGKLKNVLHEIQKYRPDIVSTEIEAWGKEKATMLSDSTWDEIKLAEIQPIGSGLEIVDPVLDYTTFTEVDPNNRYSVAANAITVTTLSRNEHAYVYKDYGVNYFDGDFIHQADFSISTASAADRAQMFCWGLSDTLNDLWSAGASDYALMAGPAGQTNAWLAERTTSGYVLDTSTALSYPTQYYSTIERDESVGTYGTLYYYIYSNEAKTVLVDTLTITLTEKRDLRYLFAASNLYSGEAYSVSGSIENLDIGEGATIAPLAMYHRRMLIGA